TPTHRSRVDAREGKREPDGRRSPPNEHPDLRDDHHPHQPKDAGTPQRPAHARARELSRCP
ncbi:hypothetical protein ACSNOK_32390, partial [Streptomyces sp. URMC 126]|uniref:hypothetical protein n=1 Tax=Streptomyces sp. URMC 126 TaxID=3423401 RepID=UPI003F1980C5